MMTPAARKLSLAAHITFSVGWLGAVVAYLALALTGLAGARNDATLAVYIAMRVIGIWVLLPLSGIAWLTGLLEALGTPWGLIRHRWVVLKFLLTTAGVAILIQHMRLVVLVPGLLADTHVADVAFRAIQRQLVVHATGGSGLLLVVMTLSIYKPWGLTAYGTSRRRTAGMTVATTVPTPLRIDLPVRAEAGNRRPRWLMVVGIHALGAMLVFLAAHLHGGGLRHH